MLWNVTLDPDEVIEEFLTGFFGEAAPFIRLYMDTFHGAVAETNYYMKAGPTPSNAPFFTPMALLTGGQAFKDAARVATAQYRTRVDVAKISVYYVVLLRWSEVRTFATKERIAWPWEPTKEAAWREFSRVWNATGMKTTAVVGCPPPMGGPSNYTC